MIALNRVLVGASKKITKSANGETSRNDPANATSCAAFTPLAMPRHRSLALGGFTICPWSFPMFVTTPSFVKSGVFPPLSESCSLPPASCVWACCRSIFFTTKSVASFSFSPRVSKPSAPPTLSRGEILTCAHHKEIRGWLYGMAINGGT